MQFIINAVQNFQFVGIIFSPFKSFAKVWLLFFGQSSKMLMWVLCFVLSTQINKISAFIQMNSYVMVCLFFLCYYKKIWTIFYFFILIYLVISLTL